MSCQLPLPNPSPYRMKLVKVKLTILALLAATASFAQIGWSRYRVDVPNESAARRLTDSPLQLFSEAVTLGSTDVIVGPHQLPLLRELGLPYTIVSRLRDPGSYNRDIEDGNPPDYKTNYLRYDEIIAQYELWRQEFPAIVQRQQIGASREGRPIWVYTLNYPTAGVVPKNILIQAGIHAREWIAPSVAMYLFDKILHGGLNSAQGFYILAKFKMHFVPDINPDGYEYTWTTDRFWRKNRRNNGAGSFGVDLNRNYSKGWGGEGSSGNPNSETYRGPSPFSEPEIVATRDYMAGIGRLGGFIDYHSFGQLILYPWAYTYNQAPDDSLLHSIGAAYQQGILNAGGVHYQNAQTSTGLYLASGSSPDYYYDAYGTMAYTVELRDEGQFGFDLPPSQIMPTILENWAGFKAWLSALP